MNNRWWFPFEGMEHVSFKPVPEGFIYHAPNPWLLGRGRHYVVNAVQKAELLALHQRTWRILFWAIVVGALAGAPFAGLYFDDHSAMTLGVSALIGLAIGFAVNLDLARRVQPVIAKLKPTHARITQGDMVRTQVKVFSRGHLIFYALLSLALFVLATLRPLLGQSGWDLPSLVGAVLFGFGTVYWLVLIVAKRNRPAL